MLKSALIIAGVLGACSPVRADNCDGRWLPGYGAPGVNGSVNAMTLWDPDGAGPLPEMLVIGGQFTVVGKKLATNVAIWDGENWSPLGDGVRGASSTSGVNALAVFNGRLYVGGEFEQAGAISTRNIASWNGSTWEALGPGMTGANAVYAMTEYQGELVVGGAFAITGGFSRIAKWNGSSWSNLGSSNVLNNTARALTVFGNKLIVGGDFAQVLGTTVGGIASWDGATWQGLGSGMSPNASVRSLRAYQSKLYAGGMFQTAGGQISPFLARWTGSDWEWPGSPFASGPIVQSVDAITECAGKLVVGGTLNNQSAVFSYDGQSWSAVGAIAASVRSLQSFGDALYAGTQNSSPQYGAGISVYRDGIWNPTGCGFDRELWAMAGYEGELVVAGSFGTAPSVTAQHAAKWNGASWSSMGTQPLDLPRSLRTHDGVLYLGGILSSPARGMVQWNGTNWAALSATLPTASSTSSVLTMAEYQGKLLAAGTLRVSGPNYDAGFLWDGVVWQSLGAVLGAGASVTTTAVYLGDLYIAGPNVRLVSDSSSGSVLRFNGTSWSKVGPNGLMGSTSDIALRVYQGKLIIASGDVRTTGAASYGPIASWDGSVVSRVGLVASVSGITAMTEYHGDLIVGGRFQDAFGVGANGVVRWNGATFAALGQGITGVSSTGRRVNCLDVYNDELIAGGDFDSAGGAASPYFARWTDNPTPWVAVDPQSRPVNQGLTLSLTAAAASGYANVTYKWQRNGADISDGSGGASPGGGTVSGASGALASPSDGASVTLTISNVQASDAGAYTVVFDNTCNSATSAAADISVITCPGDLNADGFVNDEDFSLFAGAYNVLVCEDPAMPAWCPADLNGDDLVDDLDFQIFIVGYDQLVCG